MAINILSNTRLLMQRLGFLKVICYLSDINVTIGQEKLSKNFYNLIGPGCSMPINLTERNEKGDFIYKEIIDYLKFCRLAEKYNIKSTGIDNIIQANNASECPISIELQDVLLSSPSLPSNTGAINKMELSDFTELALSLMFIREVTCNLAPSGHLVKNLFLSVSQKKFIEDFKTRRIQSNRYWYKDFLANLSINSLLLEQREKIYFLYKLLKFDGVAIYFAYKRCMEQCLIDDNRYAPFKRYQNNFDTNKGWAGFGDLFGNRKGSTSELYAPNAGIFEDICKIYEKLHYDSKTRNFLARLKRFGVEIARNRKKSIEQNGDNPEFNGNDKQKITDLRSTIRHACTVRLEPFVDIGFLERIKNPRLDYEYKFTEPGIMFFTRFISFMDKFVGNDTNKLSYKFKRGDNPLVDEVLKIKQDSAHYLFQYSIDIFLRTNFFSLINEVFNIKAHKIKTPSELIELLKANEKNILDIFGYRPIEDLFLVSMFQGGKYVDIYDGEGFLKKLKGVILRNSEIKFLTGSIKLL